MALLKRFGDTPVPNGGRVNGNDHGSGPLSGGAPPAPGSYGPPELPPQARSALNMNTGNPALSRENSFYDLKSKVQNMLIAELDPKIDLSQTAQVRRTIEELFNLILDQQGIVLTRVDRMRLFEAIAAEILGLGPIEPLLKDDSVTEIMVNGPKHVYVEQAGKLYKTDIRFKDDDHVMRVIDRIISPLGRRCDESSPMVDARLTDGSRVNAIIPPLSLVGPVLTIRKFAKTPFTEHDLVRFGSVTQDMVEFLRACVQVRLNVVVSGGTGSGKTTFLNVLSSFIPNDERIVTIEDAAELQLRQEHVVTLESRPANIEGKGRISIRELVGNALRMRPDRIIVGEVRGGEALDMLQAMNTGHDGSLTTLHSNSPRDTLARLETMVLMAQLDLPQRAIREQVASAVDVLVHQTRLKDGTRRITHITEVEGMEGEVITLLDLFAFDFRAGVDEDGRFRGSLHPTGLRPRLIDTLADRGVMLPSSVFGSSQRMITR